MVGQEGKLKKASPRRLEIFFIIQENSIFQIKGNYRSMEFTIKDLRIPTGQQKRQTARHNIAGIVLQFHLLKPNNLKDIDFDHGH